jgi:hypothetical protein
VKRHNLKTSVVNSSKQMQQTPGSSFSHRTDDDEVVVGEVAMVAVLFLLTICGKSLD